MSSLKLTVTKPTKPELWKYMHIYAIRYPENPTLKDKKNAVRFLKKVFKDLECQVCITHALNYCLAKPPDLSSGYAFQLWVWMFHNNVNYNTGKGFFSYEDYLRMYQYYFAAF
jgi:FAD-linked sulfhydryl oxidase